MCNIPFDFQGTTRYFCTQNGLNKYQCEVGQPGSGTLEDCNRGEL